MYVWLRGEREKIVQWVIKIPPISEAILEENDQWCRGRMRKIATVNESKIRPIEFVPVYQKS